MNNSALLNTSVELGFPDGANGKDPPANTGDIKRLGFDPWVGKSPGEGNGNPFQYSFLENLMDREPGGLQSMVARRDVTEAI